MWLTSLYDGMYLVDQFTTPPRISMSGIVRDVGDEIYSDPYTGEDSRFRGPGNPVAGALVIVKAYGMGGLWENRQPTSAGSGGLSIWSRNWSMMSLSRCC